MSARRRHCLCPLLCSLALVGACGDDGSGDGTGGASTGSGGAATTSGESTTGNGGAESSGADTTGGESGPAPGTTSADEETGSSGGEPGEVPLGRPAGVFGGGPFYHDADTVMPRMRASGFDTMILWSVHVHEDGDLVLNDQLIVEDGEYVGVPGWPELVVSLEEEPTTVTRTEFSVGAWGVPDFDNIAMLIEAEGTGPDSILYRNFAALKEVIPTIDAINYDDETFFQANPTIEFSLMLAELDYKVTFAPYNNMGFWIAVYDQLQMLEPGLVDRVLLQVYAGGAGNNPANWSAAFDGLEVEAGLWSLHGGGCGQGDTPAEVQTRLEGWSGSTVGGWMWLLDDMLMSRETPPSQVIVTSASSKTAMAYGLKAREREGLTLTGLTSARNADFVRSTGIYDHVVTYDALDDLPKINPTILCDFYGDAGLRQRASEALGDHMNANVAIGGTNWNAPRPEDAASGPTAEFFFAPSHADLCAKRMGGEAFVKALNSDMVNVYPTMQNLVTPEKRTGAEAMINAWEETLNGEISPKTGLIISLK